MFAKEGAKVVCANRNKDDGTETLRSIREVGGEGIFVSTDVRKKGDIERLLKATLDTYGDVTNAFLTTPASLSTSRTWSITTTISKRSMRRISAATTG